MVSYRIIKAHHAQMTFSSQLNQGTSVDILFLIIKSREVPLLFIIILIIYQKLSCY